MCLRLALGMTAADDETLILWDTLAGEALQSLPGHIGSVNAVQISADGRKAISAANDGKLIVWNLNIPINELQQWVADNLQVVELTCADREFYRTPVRC